MLLGRYQYLQIDSIHYIFDDKDETLLVVFEDLYILRYKGWSNGTDVFDVRNYEQYEHVTSDMLPSDIVTVLLKLHLINAD